VIIIFLSLFTSLYGVPPSYLCSLSITFHNVHYPPQFSHFISWLKYHLYADDTQLFFSFHLCDFDESITHLKSAFEHISPGLTANQLNLNSSETEFLLNGLKQQLSKIHSSSLNITRSTRSLGFILMNTSVCLIKSLIFLDLVFLMFVNFDVSVLILISKQPVPSPPPLFTQNMTTVTLSIIIFQSLR